MTLDEFKNTLETVTIRSVPLSEVLWGLLGSAMRAYPVMTNPQGAKKTIFEILEPFSHHLPQTGYSEANIAILAAVVTGQRTEFPWGTLEVDSEGNVVEVKLL